MLKKKIEDKYFNHNDVKIEVGVMKIIMWYYM